MDFPAKPITAAEVPEGLMDALGVDGQCAGRNNFDYLVEVKNGSNCDVVELLTDRLLWAKKTTSISDALALDTFAQ